MGNFGSGMQSCKIKLALNHHHLYPSPFFSLRLFPLLFHGRPQDPAHPGRPPVNQEKPDKARVKYDGRIMEKKRHPSPYPPHCSLIQANASTDFSIANAFTG
jgi:hypothetical protein